MGIARRLSFLMWPPMQLLHGLALLFLVPVWSGPGQHWSSAVAWLAGAYASVILGWRVLRRFQPLSRDPRGSSSTAHTLAVLSVVAIFGWRLVSSSGLSTRSLPLLKWAMVAALVAIGAGLVVQWMGLAQGVARRARGSILGWSLVGWPLLLTLMRIPAWPQEYRAESALAMVNIVVLLATALALLVWFAVYLRPGTWLRGAFLKAILVAFPVLFAVLVAELAFRMTGNFGLNLWEVYDPGCDYVAGHPNATAVWKGNFGSGREFSVCTVTNSLGFNDVEHSRAKPPGTFRVAVLGDSFVEAIQVPREENLVSQLESRLGESHGGPVEVLNFGHSGWGQVQEADVAQDLAIKFAPDLVIVEFLAGNDIRDNDPSLTAQFDQTSAYWTRSTALYRIARNFRIQSLGFLVHRLDRAVTSRYYQSDLLVYRDPPYDAGWEHGWQRTFEAFDRLNAMCRQAGVPLLVVAFSSMNEIAAYAEGFTPSLNQVDDGGHPRDYHAPFRFIEQWCDAHGVVFLNLPRAFGQLPEAVRSNIHLKTEGHWSVTGHREAARLIHEAIARQSLLPTRYSRPAVQAPSHIAVTREPAAR